MFPVEPHVNPYTPTPPDPKFAMTAYAPGPGDGMLLLGLVLAALYVSWVWNR